MENIPFRLSLCTLFCVFFTLISCSDDSNTSNNDSIILNEFTRGSGFFKFSYLNYEEIRVFFHIPSNVNPNTDILFVFHGNGRNAKDYRNAMIAKAEQYNFIVIAPEFSSANFLGGDAYNLGNIFVDGDNPSTSTLNPEEEWTFSIIEPLFDYIQNNLNNSSFKYKVFGHSAGGQFAHRFAMFKPNARYSKIVASASGWYTATDFDVSFPYGFKASPLELKPLEILFQKQFIIQVGSLDNNPNASGLRHNTIADAQGLNRFSRAHYFYDKATFLAQSGNLEFNWELFIIEGADHDYQIASQNAADLIFN